MKLKSTIFGLAVLANNSFAKDLESTLINLNGNTRIFGSYQNFNFSQTSCLGLEYNNLVLQECREEKVYDDNPLINIKAQNKTYTYEKVKTQNLRSTTLSLTDLDIELELRREKINETGVNINSPSINKIRKLTINYRIPIFYDFEFTLKAGAQYLSLSGIDDKIKNEFDPKIEPHLSVGIEIKF